MLPARCPGSVFSVSTTNSSESTWSSGGLRARRHADRRERRERDIDDARFGVGVERRCPTARCSRPARGAAPTRASARTPTTRNRTRSNAVSPPDTGTRTAANCPAGVPGDSANASSIAGSPANAIARVASRADRLDALVSLRPDSVGRFAGARRNARLRLGDGARQSSASEPDVDRIRDHPRNRRLARRVRRVGLDAIDARLRAAVDLERPIGDFVDALAVTQQHQRAFPAARWPMRAATRRRRSTGYRPSARSARRWWP